MELNPHEGKPIISFGVIADIQYADANDGYNFSRTNKRFYRGALSKLKEAVSSWKHDTIHSPSFVLQLGDIIDGLNKRHTMSESSLQSVVDVMEKLNIPLYHIWGNHEYYNFSRLELLKSSIYSGNQQDCSPVPGHVFYSIQPHSKVKILALDCYEISMLASQEGSKEFQKAQEFLSINRNKDTNSSFGLIGSDSRFVKFNGALSGKQLLWIRRNLDEARDHEQNVIVMGHCSVYAPATDVICLCWNAPEVLELLQEFSDCVLCYLAGHDHKGGDAVDSFGIHHITFPGVVENDSEADFGTMYVNEKHMNLKGNGRVKDMQIPLRHGLFF